MYIHSGCKRLLLLLRGDAERTMYHKIMDDLPKEKTVPFAINGIRFKNRKEYDERVKEDTSKLAELLYDIYQDKKKSERDRDDTTHT